LRTPSRFVLTQNCAISKELPYFKFDVSEWLLGDISDESLNMQGAFIRCCALYWAANGDLNITKLNRKVHKTTLKSLINGGYIDVDNESVLISFLDEQLSQFSDLQQKRSKAGKISAKKRATSVEQVLKSVATQSNNKEIEIDKDKEIDKEINKEVDSLLNYFNELTNSNVFVSGKKSTKNRTLIKQKLKDFTEGEIRMVFEAKYFEWQGTEMEKFVQLSTLLGNKFTSYLEQANKLKQNPQLINKLKNGKESKSEKHERIMRQAAIELQAELDSGEWLP